MFALAIGFLVDTNYFFFVSMSPREYILQSVHFAKSPEVVNRSSEAKSNHMRLCLLFRSDTSPSDYGITKDSAIPRWIVNMYYRKMCDSSVVKRKKKSRVCREMNAC